MLKRELGEEAQTALKYFRKNPKSLQWIALDAFRIWYKKPYVDEHGCPGIEIVCIEFQIKEVR